MHAVTRACPQTTVLTYRCGSKAGVYDTHSRLRAADEISSNCAFFVDKDFSDIIPEHYPTDASIFVTEVHSIENYLTDGPMITCWARELLHLVDVDFPIDMIRAKYELERARFVGMMTPLIAWVIAAKRKGARTNLRNLKLDKLLHVTSQLTLERRKQYTLSYVASAIGVPRNAVSWREVLSLTRQLKGLKPESFMRGHWDAWFFVRFVRGALNVLKQLAAEKGGSAFVTTDLHDENFVEVLGPRIDLPAALGAFLYSRPFGQSQRDESHPTQLAADGASRRG